MVLKDLLNQKKIGKATYHLCCRAGFSTVEELVEYLNTEKTFIKLNGFGDISNYELISICLQHSKLTYFPPGISVTSAPTLFDSNYLMDDRQTQIVNAYIEQLFTKLPARSKNVLSSITNNTVSIKCLADTVFENPKFDFKYINKAGKKTTMELTFFFDLIKSYVIRVKEKYGAI